MQTSVSKWLRIAFLNLNIVALIGIVLRYKIVFALPIVDQKHLLHGHSHFAFTGWISEALMTLIVAWLCENVSKDALKRYYWILLLNLVAAYGMLITFPIEGYGLFSISFSTMSIIISYFFAVMVWKDLNKVEFRTNSILWFKAGVIFNALSSLGAFSLAFMMAKHIIHQNWYLSAVYVFLHFQYNGWFYFVCMGLLMDVLRKNNITSKWLVWVFWIFTGACIPAYFLSTLWMELPMWVYGIVVLSALGQLVGWGIIVATVFKQWDKWKTGVSGIGRYLILLSGFALSLKLLLQLASTYPSLGTIAFGFHPVVIGYLHLVLLGVITVFIIGYVVLKQYLKMNNYFTRGIIIFVSGIVFNEVLLMIQGVSFMQYITLPYVDVLLFVAAIVMFVGVLFMVISQTKADSRIGSSE